MVSLKLKRVEKKSTIINLEASKIKMNSESFNHVQNAAPSDVI